MSDVDSQAAIKIRPAVPEDADGITDISLKVLSIMSGLIQNAIGLPSSIRFRHASERGDSIRQMQTAGHTTLVAKCSGEVVGFIDVRLEQPSDAIRR